MLSPMRAAPSGNDWKNSVAPGWMATASMS